MGCPMAKLGVNTDHVATVRQADDGSGVGGIIDAPRTIFVASGRES